MLNKIGDKKEAHLLAGMPLRLIIKPNIAALLRKTPRLLLVATYEFILRLALHRLVSIWQVKT
ncbi:hypothetical protein SP90_08865 [Halodesulfovibrio spirochaetisodalis]|uniref:Uncharacterized protein n=1 Tax=Halodesulfovibrio spirochaetisodalis TaxID=1560234 RepID=A0A1B7XCL8_9BACT|nr:hypothetical protein SP90_08865 [Halodesulfovibrio spirochaetisodalis]